MNAVQDIKHAAILVAVKTSMELLEQDPEENVAEAMELLHRLTPRDWFVPQCAALRKALADPVSPWHTLMLRYFALAPTERPAFLDTCLSDENLKKSLELPEISSRDVSIVFSLLQEQCAISEANTSE